MANHRWTVRLAIAAVSLVSVLSVADAQPGPGTMGGGYGMMMGPGFMGSRAFGRMCGPGVAGFVEWRLGRIERALKLTDAQRTRFDELRKTSAAAVKTMREACTGSLPATVPARVEAMEKRMEAMLQAVKTVRPAIDGFYATLTDEQKATIDSQRRPPRFWRWRDHW